MKVRNSNAITPEYYTNTQHEVIDIVDDWGLDFILGNVLKYIQRAGKKDPKTKIQDLKKASTYLNMKIQRLEAEAQK